MVCGRDANGKRSACQQQWCREQRRVREHTPEWRGRRAKREDEKYVIEAAKLLAQALDGRQLVGEAHLALRRLKLALDRKKLREALKPNSGLLAITLEGN